METKFWSWARQVFVAFLAILVLLITAADALPEQSPLEISCGCAGKPEGCVTAVFDTDGTGERLAYCALWGERETCCLIPNNPGGSK